MTPGISFTTYGLNFQQRKTEKTEKKHPPGKYSTLKNEPVNARFKRH